MTPKFSGGLAFMLMMLATATPLCAQDDATDDAIRLPYRAVPEPVDVPVVPVPRRPSIMVSDDVLAGLRGGEQLVVTNQTLTAITSGNVITGDQIAGNVSLSDSALQGFNGIGNVLINTGSQVSLQTGMNITINVHD